MYFWWQNSFEHGSTNHNQGLELSMLCWKMHTQARDVATKCCLYHAYHSSKSLFIFQDICPVFVIKMLSCPKPPLLILKRNSRGSDGGLSHWYTDYAVTGEK